MLKFDEYTKLQNVLIESTTGVVHLHLDHLEDLAIAEGKEGFAKFEEHVVSLLNFLQGLSSNTEVHAKIDGSCSIFFGIDPRPKYQNQFFVATKSAFNTGTPKINHSEEEIDWNYQGELAAKLKICLTELKKVYDNSGFVYQGDLIFSNKNEKQIKTLTDGKKYLAFKPNVLVYAVLADPNSELFNRINIADLGIVIHNSLNVKSSSNGQTLVTNTTGNKRNFSGLIQLGKQNNVFVEDSAYHSIKINISTENKQKIQNLLKKSHDYINEIPDTFNNDWKQSELLLLLKMYLNYQVRTDGGIFKSALAGHDFDDKAFKNGLRTWIRNRFLKEVEKRKLDRTKINILAKRDAIFNWIDKNNAELNYLLHATYLMIIIKNELLGLVSQVQEKLGKSFYELPDGTYKLASGEGFVAFTGNNQVKLVDRLSFSAENFKKHES